jgi:hypothetical protein
MGNKSCPYCGERIPEIAKKCSYCEEWLNDEDRGNHSSETIEYDAGGFPWLKILLFLAFGGAVFFMVKYEQKTYSLLEDVQKFERAGKYDTATLGYRVLIEKFPFSYFTIEARNGFKKIGRRADKKIRTMNISKKLPFDPYTVWILPLFISGFCVVGFIILFFFRLIKKNGGIFGCFVLSLISGSLFFLQLADMGRIELDEQYMELVKNAMNFPQVLFVACYVLLGIFALKGIGSLGR